MSRLLTALVLSAAAHFCAAAEAAPLLRLSLLSPVDFQVVQRAALAGGTVTVAGSIRADSRDAQLPDRLEWRVTGTPALGHLADQWQSLPCDSRVAAFRGELNLPAGGWYRLQVRGFRGEAQIASAVVEHVGVGEVFVVAGQSNAANYGEERQSTSSGLVAAFDGALWRLANDPEPGATGTKGSFLPLFGDEMAAQFHVPIGIVATGVGATSIREWLPAGTRLTRLPPLTKNVVTTGTNQWESSGRLFENFTTRMKLLGTHGFRCVLWHQGESDAHQANAERTLPGELYRQYLEQLIQDSRGVLGWPAPWFVAQVSYHNPGDVASPDIRAAQKAVWDDGVALPGPDTDTLVGDLREKTGTGVHLSAKGLRAHAHLWAVAVGPWLERQLQKHAESVH